MARTLVTIVAILLLFSPRAGSAQESAAGLKPELLTLARIKVKMTENLDRLPNYTCLETIERSQRLAGKGKYQLIDTLRLEVAMVDKRELYAWPGARKFEDRRLTEMVGARGGAIGDGTFGLLARSVFSGTNAQFEYFGEVVRDDRKLLRYDFRVPLMSSGFNISVMGRGSATVPYYGTFWVEPETLDVLRLEVYADDIPGHLELQRTSDFVSYARMPIGERSFLMPRQAEMSMVDIRGNENRNRIELNNCRQYTGETVLSFDEVELKDDQKRAAAPRTVAIPPGLTIPLKLETPITGRDSAIGDPVTAVVDANVKVKGQVVVPKGARLAGRLTGLRKGTMGNRTDVYWVGFDFTLLTFEGVETEIRTVVEDPPFVGRPPVGIGRDRGDTHLMFPIFQHTLNLPPGVVFRVRTLESVKEKP